MIIKNLPQIGNPKLRLKAQPLLSDDLNIPRTKREIKNLIDTMRAKDLIGMALPQIGVSRRIIAVEVRETKTRKMGNSPLRVFINPKIVKRSRQTKTDYEGCGSVIWGDLFGPVSRHQSVLVEYLDHNGKKSKESFSGIESIVIQHECDHLDGILFTDRVRDNRKLIDRDAYLKMRKKEQSK